MGSQILLTCVPRGQNMTTKVVTLDILVSPQQLTGMLGWIDWLRTNATSFQVQLQGVAQPIQLTLDLSGIVTGVWEQLFPDNGAKANAQAAPTGQNITIGGAAVSMKSSHETVQAFYSEVMLARKVSLDSLGPDYDFLQTLHEEAERRHGLSGQAATGNNVFSPKVSSSTQQDDLELILDRLAISASSEGALVQPATAGGSPQVLDQTTLPVRAKAGIIHLLDKIQNLPSTPIDVKVQSVPPAVYVSGAYTLALLPAADTWAISNAPPGLSIAQNNNILNGSPTAAQTYQPSIAVTEGGHSYTFHLNIPVTPASLPDAYVNQQYAATLFAPNGPFTWSLVSGSLPEGLNLDAPSGLVHGTPTKLPAGSAPDTTSVTFQGVSAHQTVTRILTISVYRPINATRLPFAMVNESYTQWPTIRGSAGYTWTITSGSLPAGLNLDPTTGMISGTPSQIGTGTFRVVMKDNQKPLPNVTEKDFILSAGRRHGIFVDPTTLPVGLVNRAYSVALIRPIKAAYYYQVSNSTPLPTGLTLDSYSGVLYGAPTAPTLDAHGAMAAASVDVLAIDSTGAVAGKVTLLLSIYPNSASAALPFDVYWPKAGQPLPVPELGFLYAFQFIANGATTWAVTAGSLPEGLSLDQSTGVLSGVPRNAGTTVFTVTANGTKSVSRSCTLRVEQHLLNHLNRISAAPAKKSAGQIVSNTQKLQASGSATDFAKSVSLLLNMPSLMRATGLVFQGAFTYTGTLEREPLALLLVGPTAALSIPIVYVTTQCATSSTPPLLPYSPSGALTEEGWIAPSSSYIQGCLELDAEAQKQVQFGTRAGQRASKPSTSNSFTTADPAKVSVFDEDVVHPVLPPTPRTGGLQVWLHNRQAAASKSVDQAQQDAANPSGSPRSADTLISGTAVDVLYRGKWYHLTLRTETYTFPDQSHFTANDQTHGVRMAATRRSDAPASSTTPDAFDIDETVFNWRFGSLVAIPSKSIYKYTSYASRTAKPLPSSQAVPWNNPTKFQKTFTAPDDTPSPLFGETYQIALRPTYITGAVPPWDQTIAVQRALPAFTFQRYELIQGPGLIPAYCESKFAEDETNTLMMVGSHLDEDLKASTVVAASYRVIVPAQASAEVVQRHGKPLEGAKTIPQQTKGLPAAISPDMQSSADAKPYFPDPLCIGVIATLTDIDGNRLKDSSGNLIPSINLDYYTKRQPWPNYIAHFIELQAAKSGVKSAALATKRANYVGHNFPFPLKHSKRIICTVPPGQTVLLYLHPKLDNGVLSQHALASKTSFGSSPTPYQLAFSDLCRPTVVRLSHAVDRPSARPTIYSPDWTATVPNLFSFVRTPANTMNLTVTAERLSTNKVETFAAWTDIIDDPAQPAPTPQTSTTKPSTAQLAEFQIDKHAPSSPPIQPAHLPFSDSRYRRLSMSASAYSRFASCFEKNKQTPSKKQLSTPSSPPILVDVLATAAPPAPDVYMTRYSLNWEVLETKNQVTRTCTSGCTVILNRPWNVSGNFQKLAIVVNIDKNNNPILKTADTNVNVSGAAAPSAWGFMPDFEFAGIAYFTQSSSGGSTCHCAPLPTSPSDAAILLIPDDSQIADDDPDQSRLHPIPGSNNYISLFAPRYNNEDQQWYVNLRFGAPPAYGVVVRLVVASYQHSAVEGCQFSPFTLCDFSLLTAQRYITFQRPTLLHRKVTIAVHGYGAYDKSGKLFSEIEVRCVSSPDNEFNWEEGNPLTPDPQSTYHGDVLWQGEFDLQSIVGSTILVREKESYVAAEVAEGDKQYSRQVYADVFDINLS